MKRYIKKGEKNLPNPKCIHGKSLKQICLKCREMEKKLKKRKK